MKKLFGTDGVRGKANVHPMTPEVALALGQAVARYFQNGKNPHRIVIGKDTRRSSYMIELAIAAGVCSMGSNAVLLGPMSTPGVGFITKAMRADAGIMISASHNQFEDNGIKFFDGEGFKLSDEVEHKLEAMVEKELIHVQRPVGQKVGKAYRVDDALGRYVEFVKRTFPQSLTLEGIKVVVDCANGAAYKIAPMALWELGSDVYPLGVSPNGTNINRECGALYPQNMVEEVRNLGADFGMALDGDADRVILCDEGGNVVDGDQVMALCALELKQQGELDKDTVVGTVMTNMGVEHYLKKHGIKMVRTQVGDRYIIEAMRQNGFQLGGEPSGHIIFTRHSTTGDGIIAALQVLAAMVRSGKKISELIAGVPLYPQVKKDILIRERKPLEDIPQVQQALNRLKTKLKDSGRAVMRYSGTEPLLRVMIEGQDLGVIEREMGDLVQVIESLKV